MAFWHWKQGMGAAVAVALAVAVIMEAPRTLHLLRYGERTVRNVYPLAAADGDAQDIIFSSVDLVGLEEGLSNYVSYLEVATGDVRWETPALIETQNKPAVITADGVVYIAFARRLLAYTLADGTPLWEAKLFSRMGSCDHCLALVQGRVVVLSDKALEAFDAATGAKAWSQPLAKPIRRLIQHGDTLIVMAGITLKFLDGATGNARYQAQMHCANAQNPGLPAGMDPVALLDPVEAALYLRLGSCVQRWDIAQATKRWDTGFDPQSAQKLANYKSFVVRNHSEFIQAGTALYISTGDSLRQASDHGVVRLDATNGLSRTLVSSTEHFLIPMLADEGTLYVRARAIQGVALDQLWAVDVNSAQVRWQYTPEKLADWEALISEQGLALIQFGIRQEHEAVKPFFNAAVRADVRMQRLDPISGQPTGGAPTTFTLADVLWLGMTPDAQGESAWLNFGALVKVDLNQLQKVYQWP